MKIEAQEPVLVVCPDCDGDGYGPDETAYDLVCCGNVLPSGECCAAIYGTANLVSVPVPVPTTCPRCGGYGEVEA